MRDGSPDAPFPGIHLLELTFRGHHSTLALSKRLVQILKEGRVPVMKTKKFVAASAVAMAALSIQSAASATGPGASGSGAVAVGSTVGGSFSLATAKMTATRNYTPHYSTVNAGISGATTTDSSGKAYNISIGSGSGWAKSSGSANTAVQGAAAIHGVTNGFTGGSSGTQTNDAIKAGTNQGSYVAGQTKSGFDTQVHYSRTVAATPAPAGSSGGDRSATVSVSNETTGYASGVNASGALQGMNAAGLASIGASGHFFAKAGAKGSIGQISAP
jgi:hypothetical protein